MAELAVEKNLITDPEVPLHPYNYSYIRDSFWRKHYYLKESVSIFKISTAVIFFPG